MQNGNKVMEMIMKMIMMHVHPPPSQVINRYYPEDDSLLTPQN
jgi:hypothetical protein